MPNPSGPEHDDTDETAEPPGTDPDTEATDAAPTEQIATDPDQQATDRHPSAPADAEPATEMFTTETPTPGADQTPERRFTAPGFDAGSTEIIQSYPEPATEAFDAAAPPDPDRASPQLIPPRLARKLPAQTWGWVFALVLVVLALAAIAVLGTVWLTHGHTPKVSQEDQVRAAIHDYDVAVQNGDLTTLRTITCGTARDSYLNFDDQSWSDTYRRVAAAKRYPVVASVDDVVVNGDHAEANVTAFMAYAPQTRSTRSFDLQFRDDQWKICQSPSG
jgi:hypothetical protein